MSRIVNDGSNELDEFHRNFTNPKPRIKELPEPEPMRTITIYDYIAETKPADSHFLINKFGKYRRARDPQELAYQLKDFVRTFGDKGLRALAEIHPDRELIEIECRGCKSKPKLKPETKTEPQTIKKEVIYHNASGNNASENNTDKFLIIGGLILCCIALIMKK
jgi:hypothetical protein